MLTVLWETWRCVHCGWTAGETTPRDKAEQLVQAHVLKHVMQPLYGQVELTSSQIVKHAPPLRGSTLPEQQERLREQFAAAALTGLIAVRQPTWPHSPSSGSGALCREAWQWADTMLRERPPANP